MPAPMALVTAIAIARTFDGGHYDEAWDAVEQYRRAVAYARRHNCKSGATASALDLPRGRLRRWIDEGSAPDPVQAIDTARTYGWLQPSYDDPVFTGLNSLVANVFSGGSIGEAYFRPSFTLNHRENASHVFDALDAAGVEYTRVRSDADRPTEVRPSTDETILGRVLVTLGAPTGPKADQRLSLPPYLDDAPADTKRTFVDAYLENRASSFDGKATRQIQEDRNRAYLRSLADLIEDVANDRVTVSGRTITISADAARNLGTDR